MMRDRNLLLVVLAALAVVVLSILVISASVRGTVPGDLGFSAAEPAELPADADIAGWASFDRDSYLPGEQARCRIRILWRKDIVTPDFDSFQGSVSFFPLDHRENSVKERNLSGGVREFIADFVLQAVNVETTESYLLATATVYYTSTRTDTGELQALRINPPALHIGEWYPRDISDISLLALKPGIDEPTFLRQLLMTLFGLALLGLALYLGWRYGRRRPEPTLSQAEQLWKEFDALQSVRNDTRRYILECERIFIRTLFLRTGLSATDFWAGNGEWQQVTDDARSLLSRIYHPGQPGDEDAKRISALIMDLLGPLVSESRLRREQLPSFAMRLQAEPAVVATAVFCVSSAIALFTLAAMPSSWVSTEISRYNTATAMLQNDETLQQGFSEISNLARDAEDEMVRAASLYNLGALLTDPRLSGQSPLLQRELLNAIFIEDMTLDRLLHALEIDAVFELLGVLADTARRYVQAESAMKTAVRISPDDTDARRNLEILGKVRRAIANTLAQLIEEGDQSAGLVEMQQQTIIDLQRLMEVEMPDDFAKMEKGKDDTNYFILEQF